MLKCPNCGQKTARTEDWACQRCGYPLLSRSYIVLPKTYKQLKEEKVYKHKLRPELESLLTQIEVTTEEIYSAYATDKVAADTRFRNKTLKVTGIVDKIVVDIDDDIYYVTLARAEKQQEWKVHCLFDRTYEPELNRLMMGQVVTVQGKYDGSMMNIRLRDCALVR